MDTLKRIPEPYFENHCVTILFSVAIYILFFMLFPAPFSMAMYYRSAGEIPVIFQISLKVELLAH